MKPIKVLAIVLIVTGLFGLIYGGFTYTSESHDLKLGNLELSVKDKGTLNIPVWIGGGAIVAGALVLFARQKTL